LFFVATGYLRNERQGMQAVKRYRGDSVSPNKSEINVCTSCNEPVHDDSMECIWCECLQHRSCVKISDDQYCVLANFPTNIVYFCTLCIHKLLDALIAFDKTDEVNSTVGKTLKSFEIQLSSKFDQLSDQILQVAKNSHLETIQCLVKELSKQHQISFSDLTAKVVALVFALAKDITSNSTQLTTLKSQLDELY